MSAVIFLKVIQLKRLTYFTDFSRQAEELLKGEVSFSDLLHISEELRNILDPKVDKIYAGDIFVAVDIMDTLNQKITVALTNITKQELSDFLQVWSIINFLTNYAM